jgi:hypothetical protein
MRAMTANILVYLRSLKYKDISRITPYFSNIFVKIVNKNPLHACEQLGEHAKFDIAASGTVTIEQ